MSPKAAPEQPWKSIAAAREELNARAAAALRAEVLAKRDAAPRFLDLFKSETLLAPAGTQGLTDPDDVPTPPDEAVTQAGDLWLLGAYTTCPHCGEVNEL